jgi:hypothetical protein
VSFAADVRIAVEGPVAITALISYEPPTLMVEDFLRPLPCIFADVSSEEQSVIFSPVRHAAICINR